MIRTRGLLRHDRYARRNIRENLRRLICGARLCELPLEHGTLYKGGHLRPLRGVQTPGSLGHFTLTLVLFGCEAIRERCRHVLRATQRAASRRAIGVVRACFIRTLLSDCMLVFSRRLERIGEPPVIFGERVARLVSRACADSRALSDGAKCGSPGDARARAAHL